MPGIVRDSLCGLVALVCPGIFILAMLLVPGGCATSPRDEAPSAHEPVLEKEPPLELTKRPSVVRLTDGREGFVITEFSPMDEASHRDFDRAVAMLESENYDEAIVLLERITERSPGVTAPYIDLAIAYQRIGRTKQAEENLKAALHLFPGHPVACNEYGLLYRSTGRFTEARAIYEMAIAGFPEYYPAHRNLGILCDLYLGDLACALTHYEIYSEARPDDDQVRVWVADLRSRLGRDKGGR